MLAKRRTERCNIEVYLVRNTTYNLMVTIRKSVKKPQRKSNYKDGYVNNVFTFGVLAKK